MKTSELMSLTEAKAILGVSKTKIAQLVREGQLKSQENPLDRREKLVELRGVQALLSHVGGRSKSSVARRSRLAEAPFSLRGVASLTPGVDVEAEIRGMRKQANRHASERLKRITRLVER